MSSRRQSKSMSKRMSFSSQKQAGFQSLAAKAKLLKQAQLSQKNLQPSLFGEGSNNSRKKTYTNLNTSQVNSLGEAVNYPSSKGYTKIITKRTFLPPKYPAIIVTSDFDAHHIVELQQVLNEHFIPVHMQSSRKKVKNSVDTPTDRYFIVVDQTKTEQLKGQFQTLANLTIVKYPKSNTKEQVLKIYSKQIGLGSYQQQKKQQNIDYYNKVENKNFVDRVQQDNNQIGPSYQMSNSFLDGIPMNSNIRNRAMLASAALISSQLPFPNVRSMTYDPNQKHSSLSNAKKKDAIKLKAITKFDAQEILQKSYREFESEMAVFFIYENQHQSKRYKNYVLALRDKGQIVDFKHLKKMNLKRRQLIRTNLINEYQKILKAVAAEQEAKKIKIYKYVLMGQYSAKKFVPYFKKADEIFVLCDNQKACFKVMKDGQQENIKNVTLDMQQMDDLIKQKRFFRSGEIVQNSQQPYFLRMNNSLGTSVMGRKRASTTSMTLNPRVFDNRQNELYGSLAKSAQSDISAQQLQLKAPKKFGSEKSKRNLALNGKTKKISNVNIKYPQQPHVKHYHMPQPVNQKAVKFGQNDIKSSLEKVSEQQQQAHSNNQVPNPAKKNRKIKTVYVKNQKNPNNAKTGQNQDSQDSQFIQSEQQSDSKSKTSQFSQSQRTNQAMKVSVMDEQYYSSSYQQQKSETPVKDVKQKSNQLMSSPDQTSGQLTYKTADKSKNIIISRPSLVSSIPSNSLIGILAGNGNNDDYEKYNDTIKQSQSTNFLKPSQSNSNILQSVHSVQPNPMKISKVERLFANSDNEKKLAQENLKLKLQKIAIEQKLQEQEDRQRQRQKKLKQSQVKQLEQRQKVEKQKQKQIQGAIDAIEKKQKQLQQRNVAEKAQRDALQLEKQKLAGQLRDLKKNLDQQIQKRKQRQQELLKQKEDLEKQMQIIKQQNNQKNRQFQQLQKQLKKEIEGQKQRQRQKLQSQLQKISKQNEKRRMSNQVHKGQLQKLRKQLEKSKQTALKNSQDKMEVQNRRISIPKSNSEMSQVKSFLPINTYGSEFPNQSKQIDRQSTGGGKNSIMLIPKKELANQQLKQVPKKLKSIPCRVVEQYRINQSQISFDSQRLKNNVKQISENSKINSSPYFPILNQKKNYVSKPQQSKQNTVFANYVPLPFTATQPIDSNHHFKRSFNKQVPINRSLSATDQKHKILSPLGINLDDYDKFVQNGVTVYRKKRNLIGNYPSSNQQNCKASTITPNKQRNSNQYPKQQNRKTPKKNISESRSKQKQQFLRKNTNSILNKGVHQDSSVGLQNINNSRNIGNINPFKSVQNRSKGSKILTARPQNNYFFEDELQNRSNRQKSSLPFAQSARNHNQIQTNNSKKKLNKNEKPESNRVRNKIGSRISTLYQQYQINDNKQNRGDQYGKRPPLNRNSNSKSNYENILTERPSKALTVSNNKKQRIEYPNNYSSSLKDSKGNKNSQNCELKQQNPRIQYLIPRSMENSNFSNKLKKQLNPQDALYSYINPRHLMNQINEADQIYDIIFIFENQNGKKLPFDFQQKNCFLTSIDKSKTPKIDQNRVTANSTSDLINIAHNLHKGIKDIQIANRNRKKNKFNQEYLCLYKKFNNQYQTLAERFANKLGLQKQKQVHLDSYFIPQQVIRSIFDGNSKSKNTTIITDEVGLEDLINRVVQAMQKSSSKKQSIVILVIPRGQYYQYSYQRFCGMEIQDLNDLGISIKWITKSELEGSYSHGIDHLDKLYIAHEQTEIAN